MGGKQDPFDPGEVVNALTMGKTGPQKQLPYCVPLPLADLHGKKTAGL